MSDPDYRLLQSQLSALLAGESDPLANASNFVALLKTALHDVNWLGIYVLRGDELVLGPFQGLPACVRIPLGKGVCGTAAAKLTTLRVDDVHAFPGHIACDAASRSELVVPLLVDSALVGVLDIDSPSLARFSAADQKGVEDFVRSVLRTAVRQRSLYLAPCLADARHVLARARIDSNHFALIDKQRHAHHSTGCQRCRLAATAGSIAFDTRIRLRNLQFNKIRCCNDQWRIVPQRYLANVTVADPVTGLTDRTGVRRILLEGIRNHEMPELAVRIQVLHIGFHDIRGLHALARLERLVDRLAGLQIANTNPAKRLAFSRFYELVFDNDAGVTVYDDFQA